MRRTALTLGLTLLLPAGAPAQTGGSPVWEPARPALASEEVPAGAEGVAAGGVIDGARRWAGPAKWIALGGTAALAGLGFAAHGDAEEIFRRLVALCADSPDRCRRLNPDGSYQDAEAESLFQEVLARDGAARAYLVGSQVTLAATVAFFILDLKKDGGPRNIPYEPKALRLSVRPGEVRLAWSPF